MSQCLLPGLATEVGSGAYSGRIGAAPGYTAEEPCRKNESLRCGNTQLHFGGSITQMLVAIHVMVIGARVTKTSAEKVVTCKHQEKNSNKM